MHAVGEYPEGHHTAGALMYASMVPHDIMMMIHSEGRLALTMDNMISLYHRIHACIALVEHGTYHV